MDLETSKANLEALQQQDIYKFMSPQVQGKVKSVLEVLSTLVVRGHVQHAQLIGGNPFTVPQRGCSERRSGARALLREINRIYGNFQPP